jgi:hypothetical protein
MIVFLNKEGGKPKRPLNDSRGAQAGIEPARDIVLRDFKSFPPFLYFPLISFSLLSLQNI